MSLGVLTVRATYCRYPLLFIATVALLGYENKCFLACCNSAEFADLMVGAPADAAWDAATGVMPLQYAQALVAGGACGSSMPLTDGGWFGYDFNQPHVESIYAANAPFVDDVCRVVHGAYPAPGCTPFLSQCHSRNRRSIGRPLCCHA